MMSDCAPPRYAAFAITMRFIFATRHVLFRAPALRRHAAEIDGEPRLRRQPLSDEAAD